MEVSMNILEQRNYLDLIFAINEFLNYKLNSLDEEISGKPVAKQKNNEAVLISGIVEKGEFVYYLSENAKKEQIVLRGYLADILETTYQYIIKERESRNSVHKEKMVLLIPEYMAISRRLLEKLEALKADIENSNALKGEYEQDSRVELILNALKKSTEFSETIGKEYKYRPWLAILMWVLIFGTSISVLVLVFMKCYDATTEILYLMTARSQSPVKSTDVCSSICWDIASIISITFVVLLAIALIAFKIRGSHLKREIEKGNVSARFVYANYYQIPLIAKLRPDFKKYVYEILECAKSGYPLALYQAGQMYEYGYGRIIEKNLSLSISCYSRASRYIKKAQERYKVLTKNFN